EFTEASQSNTQETVPSSGKNGERFVILAIQRNKSISPMYTTYTLQKKDVAFVALYRPELEQALVQLHTLGWRKSTEESIEESAPASSSRLQSAKKEISQQKTESSQDFGLNPKTDN
ncbi:MAG: hypothetical protein AB7P17_09880, partial [Nitrospirales bacterium]